jgi:hypothetical protein
MEEMAVRKFEITPSQYQLFRFNVGKPTTLQLRMIATAPVNVMLLDDEDRGKYESGKAATHPYTAAWGRRSELEESVKVEAGTWYLVIEGSSEPSTGRIEILQGG